MVKHFSLYTILFLILSVNNLSAQVFKGTVVDEETGDPVPHSIIFLTNTTLGVSADQNGDFSIDIPQGNYEVVVRMQGYDLLVFTLRTEEMGFFYRIKLKSDVKELQEFKIEEARDALWYNNLETFKIHFLGTSANARKCKILNPEVLILDSDSEKGVLKASAVDALLISNPNLGYEIEYILTHFKLDNNISEVYYQGYPAFKNLSQYSSRLPNRIERNREKAYMGSIHHFLKSVYDGNSDQEGYKVREIRMVSNPDRPSDMVIDSAKVIMEHTKDFEKRASLYNDIVHKERLPKTIMEGPSGFLNTARLIRILDDGQVLFNFRNVLEVTYNSELEERAYHISENILPRPQTSLLKLNVPGTIINHQGATYNPLDIFLLGYMAWEKMGDLMPVDYNPRKNVYRYGL